MYYFSQEKLIHVFYWGFCLHVDDELYDKYLKAKLLGLAARKTRCICCPENAICNLWAAQTNGHWVQFSGIRPSKSTQQINYSLDKTESRRCFCSMGEGLVAIHGWKDPCIYWLPLYLTATGGNKSEGKQKCATSLIHLVREQTKPRPMRNITSVNIFSISKFSTGMFIWQLVSKGDQDSPSWVKAISCWLSSPRLFSPVILWLENVLYLMIFNH